MKKLLLLISLSIIYLQAFSQGSVVGEYTINVTDTLFTSVQDSIFRAGYCDSSDATISVTHPEYQGALHFISRTDNEEELTLETGVVAPLLPLQGIYNVTDDNGSIRFYMNISKRSSLIADSIIIGSRFDSTSSFHTDDNKIMICDADSFAVTDLYFTIFNSSTGMNHLCSYEDLSEFTLYVNGSQQYGEYLRAGDEIYIQIPDGTSFNCNNSSCFYANGELTSAVNTIEEDTGLGHHPFAVGETAICPGDSITLYYPWEAPHRRWEKVGAFLNNTSDSLVVRSVGSYFIEYHTGCEHRTDTIEVTQKTDGCDYGEISGRVFHDADQDGIMDPEEEGVKGITVYTSKGNFAVTDESGSYTMQVREGGTYAINFSNSLNWEPTTSEQSVTVPETGYHYFPNVNFGAYQEQAHDAGISLSGGPFRPGFESNLYFVITNHGIIDGDGFVTIELPSEYSVSSASESYTTDGSGNLIFDYPSLAQGEEFRGNISGVIPATTELGTELEFTATVYPNADEGDYTDNNEDDLTRLVIGSYDPNDKLVDPSADNVPKDTTLEYTIRFQNTGTDTAFFVYVKDTLDADLDVSTFEMISASHPYSLEVNKGRELIWRFDNILLPDSNRNEPESHGYINYRIKPKTGLNNGTEVTNTANIYFDYNLPITTNTTVTTLGEDVLSAKAEESRNAVAYPVPSTDRVTIKADGLNGEVEIFNAQGNIVRTLELNGNSDLRIERKGLASGVYSFRIISDDGKIKTGKIVFVD